MAILSITVIGLVIFVTYLSYAKFLFFAALIYLPYSLYKYGLIRQDNSQRPTMQKDGLSIT